MKTLSARLARLGLWTLAQRPSRRDALRPVVLSLSAVPSPATTGTANIHGRNRQCYEKDRGDEGGLCNVLSPTRKGYTERQGDRILATNSREDEHMADIITSDPDGRPVIAGTQVTVKEVLKELAAWGSVDQVLTAHPELDRDAVRAALVYAADIMRKMASAPPAQPSPEEEHFVPRTEFGKELWELRKKVLEELRAHNEPLLDAEGIRREVHERRGERHVDVDR